MDFNQIEKLVRNLQNAAYSHGLADSREYASNSFYDKAYARSEDAADELMNYNEKGLKGE